MTTFKPDFNRIVTTLMHKEPDRVPLAEAAVAFETMSKFLGKEVVDADIASQVEFWTKAGYDYIALTAGMMQPGKVTKDSVISKVIQNAVLQDDDGQDESWNLEKRAVIHTEKDFETFPWDEAAKLDLSRFNQAQDYLPEGMKIIALSGKIFTLSWLLMGYENFCMNLALNPQFVENVIQKVAEIQFQALKEIINIPNIAAVWAVDDLAFGSGTMISPASLRQYIFPWYKKFGKLCHEHGLYFFFHSDGVLWSVMDDLLDLGIDALHPIDPTCLDIEEVKRKVGDKITLIGNISNEILMEGSPEQVAELVKHRIKTLAPGGGYCVGSGNSVPDWAKIENFKAMIETTLEYGCYPINIDAD